jgi:hypothetical protein
MLPIAHMLAHTTTHYRVTHLVLKPGVKLDIPAVNAYYVSGTDTDIVLMDRWADPGANIVVLARSDVTAMVLRREVSRVAAKKLPRSPPPGLR